MLKKLKWKIILIVLLSGLAIQLSLPLQKKINLGLDLQGGMHLVLQVDSSQLSEQEKKGVLERALAIVRNRIDQFGVSEPSIQTQGKDRIVVQLPGVTERERAIELLGKTALLEFKLVENDPEKLKAASEGNIPDGYELKQVLKRETLLLQKQACLTGKYLVDANMRFGQQFNQPTVALQFNPEGAKQFAKITSENTGSRLAIVLDGEVQSAPVIREPIPNGEAVISGNFSQTEANDLAIILRAGALPAPIHIEEERTVGPSLGRDSITKGIRATLWGGVIVILFMAVYYLLAGLIANFALCLNLIFILAALSYFKATLTLPGIAGMILTIGMSVDANVLIFERIREELRLGKTPRASIEGGYGKALVTILDANITTL
ncbi:MAG: protein translocase subunit SecD, partial [Candidatus Omnitrophica bacterium]|nr:protein translocase subunit SecD [Candidatus Omnitrophota bacterium]